MGKVYVLAGFMIVIAAVAIFGLIYAKIAQKAFQRKNDKGINK